MVNVNGDSCDVFQNIYLEPEFVNPSGVNFNLMSISPCIDAGDPELPLDPDGSVVEIGALTYVIPQEPVIAFSVTEIIFPDTELGLTEVFPLTVYNNCTLELVLDSMVCLSYPEVFYFDFDPLNNTIAPGDSQITMVSFTPAEIMAYEDMAFIYNNGDLGVITLNGAGITVGVETPDSGQPLTFRLHPASPNPFNPGTELTFTVDKPGMVRLAVYDLKGREVVRLADGSYSPGTYSIQFDGRELASGMYFARLVSGERAFTQKLLLVK